MKTDPENIPAQVYDLAGRLSFDALNDQQKQAVLRYMDEHVYSELHHTMCILSRQVQRMPATHRAEKKQALLAAFDAKKQVPVPIWKKTVALWKAAAIVVVLLAGWLYVFMGMKKEPVRGLVAKVDTVYVTKEVPSKPVSIYDTVYVTKYVKSSKKEQVHAPPHLPAQNGSLAPRAETLNTVNIHTLDSRSNQPKGNSMKDDTLLKKYSFVTM